MTTIRRFVCDDLFEFNNVNLDVLTETVRRRARRCHPHSLADAPSLAQYGVTFYLQYLAKWPEYFLFAEGPGGACQGYSARPPPSPPSSGSHSPSRRAVMGKAEGKGENWHGHVSAVTVAPEYRRQSLAAKLMGLLEETTVKRHNGYFVDLFVRLSNSVAIGMYERFGYVTFRRVINYYSGEEDALDMRKAMPRDVDKKSMIPLPKPVHPYELGADFIS